MRLEMKTFLSHKHCQALMDRWWRGGFDASAVQLEPDVSFLYTAALAMCPPINRCALPGVPCLTCLA